MVEQAVEQRRGDYGVLVEDADPVFVDSVGGHQGGATLVAVADDMEQAVGAELVDGQVPACDDGASSAGALPWH